MSVYFETWQTVIQSTPTADFSFGFTEGNSLLLNGQKHLRSVADDLISNKQTKSKRIYQERRRYGHYKTLKPIFLNSDEDVIFIAVSRDGNVSELSLFKYRFPKFMSNTFQVISLRKSKKSTANQI